VILLTGATGLVGSALLPRLTASGEAVRCLVRDPRRLGTERVRVQIALFDLASLGPLRNVMRGVDTVIHLAASIRDQRDASLEEVTGIATVRMLRAAEDAGVRCFVFFSALGATLHSPSRFLRAKALAEQAVESSSMETLIFAPSIVYAPGDPWLALLERLAHLPALPVSGSGRSVYQPIWADDVARCVSAALDAASVVKPSERSRRFELAGPQLHSYNEIAAIALRSFGRERRLMHIPLPVVRAVLRITERIAGSAAFATWDEAALMEISMTTPRGAEDAKSLGVSPLGMAEVLRIG